MDLHLQFKRTLNMKNINIVDPCFSKNNLGRSISVFNSYRLKEALKYQAYKMRKIYKTKSSAKMFAKLCHQFKYTFEAAGKSHGI